MTDDHAKSLLNFQGLFNTLSITTAYTYARSDMKKEWVEYFNFQDYDNLLLYLRYMAVEHGFGGLTKRLTPKEIVFGYRNEVLDWVGK